MHSFKVGAESVDIIAFSKNKSLFRIDPSFIYRCINISSVLRGENILNFIGHIKEYTPSRSTKVLFLHRPVYSIALFLLIRKLKKRNIKVIADVDDLIIHSDFSHLSPAVVNNILSNKQVSKRFFKNYKALKLCDHITCSTNTLKTYLIKYFPETPVTVLHNSIYHSWNQGCRDSSSRQKVITYFPGTKSHDRDFELIKEPLEAFLGDTPSAILSIVGPVSISLNTLANQVTTSPKVSFFEYEAIVKASSINLAPLESSLFNDCKSGLKAIEAGAFGIPTIFSPNEDANRFNGSAVLIAETSDDWYKHLSYLYKSIDDGFNHNLCYENTRLQADISNVVDKLCKDVLDYDYN